MMNFSNSDEVFNAFFFMNANLWKEKPKIRGIFNDVWKTIPYRDKATILGNLEYIICKPILDQISFDDGGITVLSPATKCLIILNSKHFSSSLGQLDMEHFEKDTIAYFLAHELAHVFFNHPVEMIVFSKQVQNDFIEEEAKIRLAAKKTGDENLAYDKAHEWGFAPNQNDIGRLPGYNRWLRSKIDG